MKQSLPIYRQIEQYLEGLIESNHHVENYKLPSENQLANKFNASRITAQRALKNMESNGSIIRMQGKGSFINHIESAPEGEKSEIIYLLLPDIERRYSREVINGAHDFFHEKGISLSVAMSNNDPEVEEEKIRKIVSHHCQGIILFPVIHMAYHKELLKLALANYPIVIVGNSLPGMNFSSVHCNYYQQIYNAVLQLIEKGHRNIGCISEMSTDSSTYKERLNGYTDCMAKNVDIKVSKYLELDFYPETHQSFNRENIESKIHSFLHENPDITALITTDLALEYILSYIDGDSCYPARELYLVIIDGPDYTGMIKNRRVSIIEQSPKLIGRLAAEQLYNQIHGGAPPREITTEDRMIEL